MLGQKAREQKPLQLRAIEDPDQIAVAFEKLRGQLLQAVKGDKPAAYYDDQHSWLVSPRDKKPCETFWFGSHGFWVSLETWNDHTYFISYGHENPEHERDADAKPELHMDFQTNVKRNGRAKNTAGAFAVDSKGHTYYVHTGRARRARFFHASYLGRSALVTWQDNSVDKRFIIADLDDTRSFLPKLASYAGSLLRAVSGDLDASPAAYRNALQASIVAELNSLPHGDQSGTGSVSATRRGHLRELLGWLDDDPELLEPAMETFANDKQHSKHVAFLKAVGAGVISLTAGWLISAVNPHDVLNGVAAGVSGLMALVR